MTIGAVGLAALAAALGQHRGSSIDTDQLLGEAGQLHHALTIVVTQLQERLGK